MNRVRTCAITAYLALLSCCATPTQERPRHHPLAWLEGHWVGKGLGGEVEEVWLPERGGAMTCVFRMLEGGVVKFYELVTIQRTAAGNGFEMRLKHFAPDLAGWEERDETNVWPLESLEKNSATFGPVTYSAPGSDRLRATVRTQAGDQVEVARIEMRRTR